MRLLRRVRVWLLEILIGSTSVVANITTDCTITVKPGAIVFGGSTIGGIKVDGPCDVITRGLRQNYNDL